MTALRRTVLALTVLSLGLAAGCQMRPGNSGNVTGSRQPIGEPRSIAEQSRAVQGGSFGNR